MSLRVAPLLQALRSTLSVCILCALLPSCSSQPYSLEVFVKAVETQAYGELAEAFSNYCERVGKMGPLMDHQRIEMSREIRQHGTDGPFPPAPHVSGFAYRNGDTNNLDGPTRYGSGPVVMVWCERHAVPDAVWLQLDRYWRD